MTDLREQLQNALGDAFRIERELGGGGMSRLFLAEGSSLHRRVVVKALPSEMARARSAARFRQELVTTKRPRRSSPSHCPSISHPARSSGP